MSAIEAADAIIVVGDQASCEHRRVIATEAVWYGPATTDVVAQVRARMAPVPAEVAADGATLALTFAEPVCAAPGQAVVCYEGDVVVGGGTIRKAFR